MKSRYCESWTVSAFLLCCTLQGSADGFAIHPHGGRPTTTRFHLSSATQDPSGSANLLPNDSGDDRTNKDYDTTLQQQKQQELLLQRNTKLVQTVKHVLFDVLYAGPTLDRAFARFYALETIARMPYFSYLSVLHLWETLGRWRQADRLALHFAESFNELHHLLIMEELLTTTHNPAEQGQEPHHVRNDNNDQEVPFRDRFIAQHLAFFYYWLVVGLYLVQPAAAYNLNQAVEQEAYATYDAFLQRHEEYLQSQPAPAVAVEYYTGSGQALFDTMHHNNNNNNNNSNNRHSQTTTTLPTSPPQRRVKCETLYDCFVAIRDDELEHANTMEALQQQDYVNKD